MTDTSREKNVTWNEASKKVRNKKVWAKFVREQEEQYLPPERVKQDKEYNKNKKVHQPVHILHIS